MSDPRDFFKPGAVVYFKKCLRRPTQKADGISAKGYLFGVMLGVVPPFAPDPPPDDVIRLMANAGFISFDDILEMLGQQSFNDMIEKFGKKYALPTEEVPAEPAPSKLVGLDGKPLEKN